MLYAFLRSLSVISLGVGRSWVGSGLTTMLGNCSSPEDALWEVWRRFNSNYFSIPLKYNDYTHVTYNGNF